MIKPLDNVVACILAGGSGTRLWPLSRQMFPKQMMHILGNESLLTATVNRLNPFVSKENVWVVTNQELAQGAGYRDLQGLHYILEPTPRNTAPAIGVMAAYLNDFHDDPIMLILPADHVIQDVGAFHDAIALAVESACTGHLVTFGIQPTRPETGYGYIQACPEESPVRKVLSFVEKPDLITAQQYLQNGCYYWNSGMFVAKSSVILKELAIHAPVISSLLDSLRREWHKEDYVPAIAKYFPEMPNISIDYAVLEKSSRVKVVPCHLGWSDVGTWDAVYDILPKDNELNAIQASAVTHDCHGNLILGQERVIAALGVENLCIIDTSDALLVLPRHRVQEVKKIVDVIKSRGGTEYMTHRSVVRPWGKYTILQDNTPGYKIKRIDVNPHSRLSMQSHAYRSEHWVIVAGRATVTCHEKTFTLNVGESTFIPLGARHRLENMENSPLQIVETQVGSYLNEDDITRYDDTR